MDERKDIHLVPTLISLCIRTMEWCWWRSVCAFPMVERTASQGPSVMKFVGLGFFPFVIASRKMMDVKDKAEKKGAEAEIPLLYFDLSL